MRRAEKFSDTSSIGAPRGPQAVTTLEDTDRIARRVLGGAHPTTLNIEDELQDARDALHARGLP